MQSIVPEHNTSDLNPVTGLSLSQDPSLNLRVENIVSGTYILNNAFYKKYILVSQDHVVSLCIHMDEGGFSFEDFQLELRVCVDAIYRDGAYFEGLNNELLETALYGTQEELRSVIDPTNHTIKICSGIRKMTDSQSGIFNKMYKGGFQIAKDNMEVIYIPNQLDFIKRQFGENYQNNEMFLLRSDLFHAYFWSFGIRYYGKSSFLKQINMQGRDKLDDILKNIQGVVAIGKKVTDTKHDTIIDYEAFEQEKGENEKKGIKNASKINYFPPLKPVLKALVIDGKTALGGEKICTFPMAKGGQCILEIILGELGNTGITISGIGLPCAEIKHITILNLFEDTHSEYINIDETDPRKFRIIAKEDVYISLDKEGKLGFSRHKKYVGPIGSKDVKSNTGSIILPMDKATFEHKGAIQEGYYIKGYDIIYSGELRGKIFAQNNVIIKGGGVIGGTIIAEHGNITIDGNVIIQDGTRLEAINGKVTINGDLNNTTIVASKIEVLGTATNCTFIGGNVSVEENNGRSKIMAETFAIKNDKSLEAEYTVLVYAGIHGLINTLDQEIKNSEGKGILEASRITNIGKLLDGAQDLINGTIHLDAKIQLLVIPFLIQESLFEFLIQNNHTTVLLARKKHGLLSLVSLDTRADGIICKRDSFPLTRTKTITLLEEKLQSRYIPREERNPLYMRGVRIKATVGQLGGNIFDYTSNGCSFILLNDAANSGGNIIKDSTIDVSILDHSAVSFFVTRAENRELKELITHSWLVYI